LLEILIFIPGQFFLLIFTIFSISLFVASIIILKNDGSMKNSLPIHVEPYEIAYIRGGIRTVIETAIFSLVGKNRIEIIGDAVRISGNKSELNKIERKVFNFFEKNSKLKDILLSEILKKNIKTSLSNIIVKLEKLELIENKRLRNKKNILFFIDYFLIFITGGLKIYFGLSRGKPSINLIILFSLSLVIFYKVLFEKNKRVTELGKLYLKTVESNLTHIKTKIISKNDILEIDIPIVFAIFGAGIFITIPTFVDLSTTMQIIENTMSSSGGADGGSGCSGCSSGCSSCGGCGGCGGD
jgi:uncharacterized protein (TIGR04222 family)